jgi:hypothetical protein
MNFEQMEATSDFVGEHELHIGTLTTPMRVRIFRRHSDGALLVEQSHFLRTDVQYLSLTINQPFFCTESEVLDQLMATMMTFYDQAVKRDFKPSEKWLMVNSAFKDKTPSVV